MREADLQVKEPTIANDKPGCSLMEETREVMVVRTLEVKLCLGCLVTTCCVSGYLSSLEITSLMPKISVNATKRVNPPIQRKMYRSSTWRETWIRTVDPKITADAATTDCYRLLSEVKVNLQRHSQGQVTLLGRNPASREYLLQV